MMDISICGLLVVLPIAFIFPDYYNKIPDVLYGFFGIILWSLVEPFLLVNMGNTIGKRFLNTKINSIDGLPISYKQFYKRSFTCSLKGLGLSIHPIITIITMIISFGELSKVGSNSWNRNNGLEIIHNRVGFFRITIVVVFLLTLGLLGVLLE